MAKVVVSIPKLGVTKRGAEGSKEIYVIGFATDQNNLVNRSKDSVPIAAYNETLPNSFPEIYEHSFLKFFTLSVSNIFREIKADQPVSLSGSGIILYPNLDPKDMLALHFVILESDKGKRDFLKALTSFFDNDNTKKLLQTLSQNPLMTTVASVLGYVSSSIRNRDDYLLGHSHTGFNFDNYGVTSPDNIQDFEIGNHLAYCTLRIRVNKD